MNTPWIIGTFAAIVFFAIFEARAFRYPDRQNTLSRAIYNIGQSWPLSIFLMGMFCGGLAVHFFWHWCPPGSFSTGFLERPAQVLTVGQTIKVGDALCVAGRCERDPLVADLERRVGLMEALQPRRLDWRQTPEMARDREQMDDAKPHPQPCCGYGY